MKKAFVHTLFLTCLAFLTSCLEQDTTITLNSDGSGTIVEETVFGKDMIDMLEMAALQGGGQGGDNPLEQILDEKQARAKAASYGEGVKFVSIAPLNRNGGKGAKVTYKFADINQIKLNPSNALSDMGPQAGKVEQADSIGIKYEGKKLTLTFPDADEEALKDQDLNLPQDENNPEAAMMMQMFKGMKIRSRITMADGIAETNASHVDGDTLTLFAVDFGQLMENPEGLNALKKLDLKDREKASKELAGLKGVKVETKKEVQVLSK